MQGIGFYGEDFMTIKEGKDLLFENITRLILTSVGERVMSNYGSRLKEYLFAPETVLREEVISELDRAINRWEPRVRVKNIETEMTDTNEARIKIVLSFKETLETLTYDRIVRF